MAAGRIDFTRRRRGFYESYNKNGSRGGGSDHGAVYCRNGHRDSSALSKVDIRRSGSSRREEERGYEIQKEHGDGVQLPLEKKRKFSPIIWELAEKKARASSVNQDASLSKGFVAEESVNNDGSESSVILSPSSPQDEQWGDDIEEGQVEEEALGEARNLSSSRWASDDDEPMITTLSHNENTPRETGYRKTVSPENEELRKDDSCGDRSNSTVFDGDCSVGSDSRNDNGNIFEGGDLVDVDKMEDAEVSDLIEEPASTHRSVNMLQESRSVYEFEYLHEINEGTYGKVYKARDKKTGEEVALKKVKMDVGKDIAEDYGFPLSALREINILLSLRHPAIVNVKEVVMGDLDSVFMVMEHMDHDLKGLMQAMKQPFSTSEVKCLMLQLLEGVKCLHDNWVLHRDLKTSNLLYKDGQLKICDFGMSRQYGSPLKPYTSLVVTLWYRAPELLLGAKQYSTAVDMWSVGCIMAELLGKEPLFQGKREIEQLQKIFETLGTPNEKIWPGLSKLPGAKAKFAKHQYNQLRKKFPAASFTGSPVLSDLGFDLLNKLLTYDPEKRITADDALHHSWFHEVPLPKSIAMMPTFPPTFPQLGKKRHVQGIMKSPNPRSSGGRQWQVLSDTSESVA